MPITVLCLQNKNRKKKPFTNDCFLMLKKETVDQSFIKYFFYDDKMEIGKKTFTVLPIKSVS